MEDEVPVPMTPFRLSQTPGHAVNHVTKDVTIRCDHNGHNQSKLRLVTSIKLLRKSPKASEWELLAQYDVTQDQPTRRVDAHVSGWIDHQNVVGTFLEISWPVAVEVTFGTYRCDVTGVRLDSDDTATEITSLMDIVEEDVNAGDMFSLFVQLRNELSGIDNSVINIFKKVTSLNGKCITLANGINLQDGHTSLLTGRIDDVDKLLESTKTEIDAMKRDTGSFELAMSSINKSLSSVTQNIAAFDPRTNAMDSALESVDESLDTVTGDLTSLNEDTNLFLQYIQSANATADSATQDLSELKRKLDVAFEGLESDGGAVVSLENEVQSIDGAMLSLRKSLQSLKDQASALTDSLGDYNTDINIVDKINSWPEGNWILLQPQTGCPLDLAFFGQGHRYFQIHTESSSIKTNKNYAPDLLGHYVHSTEKGNNFLTLWFCEANGIFNKGDWPKGSYCVNRRFPGFVPFGFEYGSVVIDQESTDRVVDHTSSAVFLNHQLYFACRNDGKPSEPIVLPTASPFILYRVGGRCQEVQGMDVLEEKLVIDTEDSFNQDHASGTLPARRNNEFESANDHPYMLLHEVMILQIFIKR